MSNDTRIAHGMNSEFDLKGLADALTYAASILREGATDGELVEAVLDVCAEVGMVNESTPQEEAIDELIDARVALMRLGMSFEVQGNEDYHDAYRSISGAVGKLGMSTRWLAELADARLALQREQQNDA